MIDYEAGKVFELAAQLGLWQATATMGQHVSDIGRERIPAVLQALRDSAGRHGMEALAVDIGKRLTFVEANLDGQIVGQQLAEISARFASDLGCERFCHFSTDERRLLFDDYPFGREAMEAYPEIIGDAREASRCYAMGRYTATVFHSARVCEALTRHLARRCKVTFDANRAGMGGVLNRIDKALRASEEASAKKRRPQIPRAKFRFVSAAVAILRPYKDGWRDAVAHPGKMFDVGEALSAYTVARQITAHLGQRT